MAFLDSAPRDPLDPSYSMGEQSPLARPLRPEGETLRNVEYGGAREAAAASVKHMREAEFTPLGLALELGGGPGGAPLAGAAAPAVRALAGTARRAITSLNFRELPLDQAVALARTEQHLMKTS